MGYTQHRHRHRRPQEEEEEEILQVVVVQEEDDEISTFYCKICMNFISSVMKFKNNKTCGHLFCHDCMAKYIHAKVEDGWAHINCPWWGCTHFLDPIACRPVLSVPCFNQWCDLLCDSYVLGFERCYCSYSDCSALIVNECGGNVDKVNCPNCKRIICFQWNVPWLTGYGGCGEERDSNDVLFGKFVEEKKWAICPQCRHCVELIEGCRIVRCRCRTQFCYRCGTKREYHWCLCSKAANNLFSGRILCGIKVAVILYWFLLILFHLANILPGQLARL